MSFILEALRRAEHERTNSQLGASTPAAVASPGEHRRPRVLIALAVLLLVNAVVLAILLLRKPAVSVPPTAPVTESFSAAAPTPIQQAVAPVPTSVEAGPAVAVVEDAVGSLDDLGADAAETETASEFSAPPAPHPRAAQAAAEEPVSADEALDESEMESFQPEAAESTASPAATDSSQAAAEITELRDLPGNFQSALSGLKVEVHNFDADAQRRFVLINGHRYREGQSLPLGPRLVEIVPEGMVFEYQGRRTLYPLAGH